MSNSEKKSVVNEIFTSRWALVLAALGMAIGTGNIWRFPRIVAQNGGAIFLIPWILFLLIWSIPLLMVEFAIGKHTRMGPIGAFTKLIGKRFAWMGAFVTFCTTAIMFYYAVVMGWCLKYFVASLTGGLEELPAREYWDSFVASNSEPVLFHFIAVTITAVIVYRGVIRGIERANKILIPAILTLLIMIAVRALTLDNAVNGLNYLFHPHWQMLWNHNVWLHALSQSAWSTGAGWGLLLTYAIYSRQNEDIVLNSMTTGLGNNSASLLSGIAIFPAVFALAPLLGLVPEAVITETGPANTGLSFIWIPQLFQHCPMGSVFMPVFFLALSFAALSSLIAMFELITRVLVDMGMKRKPAIRMIWIGAFLFGIPSAINMEFFANQDWVWGVGLIVSGGLFITAVNLYGVERFRTKLINSPGNDIQVGRWLNVLLRYVIPLEFIILIGWWFWQSIQWDPQTWWHPFKAYSLGTCLFQWGLVILLFGLVNKKLANKVLQSEDAA